MAAVQSVSPGRDVWRLHGERAISPLPEMAKHGSRLPPPGAARRGRNGKRHVRVRRVTAPFLVTIWCACSLDLGNQGCVRFENVREWNGTVPFLGGVLVFGSGIEWNGLVPRKGIFFRDAECTHPPKSAGRGGMEIRLIKFSYN
jgi:hypothetical protein